MLVIQFNSICTTNTIGNTIELKQIQLKTLANTIERPSNTFGNTIVIVLPSQFNLKLNQQYFR